MSVQQVNGVNVPGQWLTNSLGREITSSKDVTKDEASNIIDWMNTGGDAA